MAIDPSIPLSIRPQQQIALPQIQSPIDRYGRLLTLRNLMDQGQYRALQMQQLQQEMEAARQAQQREQAFMESFRNPQPETVAPAGIPAPVAPSIGRGTGGAPYTPMTPTSGAGTGPEGFFPATPQPSAPPRLPSTTDTLRMLGTKGIPVVKAFAELETERRRADVERLKAERDKWDAFGSLAGTAKDEKSKNMAVGVALSRGLITPEQARAEFAQPYDAGRYEQFRRSAIAAKDQADDDLKRAQIPGTEADTAGKVLQNNAKILAAAMKQGPQSFQAQIARLKPEDAAPFLGAKTPGEIMQRALNPEQYMVGERAAAQAAAPGAAQQEFQEIFLPGYLQKKGVTGKPTPQQVTEAYTEFQKIRNPYMPIAGRDFPKPQSVEDQDARLRARADVNGLSVPQFNQIHTLARAFDSSKAVKDFREINDKYKSVVSILNKPSLGGPGDVAFVFEAMHGIEPGSVVRSDEFARVANSGNIFAGPFARFNGYLKPNGGFLPPGVKQAFMEMLKQKVASHGQSIHKVYQDLGRRIDLISGQPGTGTQYLTDYSGVLGEEPAGGGGTGVQGMSTDELLKLLLKK